MWQNWAGNQGGQKAPVKPVSLGEMREILNGTDGPVRPVGAGHSFTPIVAGGQIVDPSGLPGPIVQEGNWIKATARLKELSQGLEDAGLAFRNLGDINVQSLAGAAATATHGTGETLPCLSAELTAARLMIADGEMIEIGPEGDPDLLRAARVSMGTLGILTEARLNLMPRYRLRRQVSLAQVDQTLGDMARHWRDNRHFEFFFIPALNRCIQIFHNISEAPSGQPPRSMDEAGVLALRFGRNVGRVHPALRRAVMALVRAVHSDEDYVGDSWRVLSSPRNTRFVEMEYHLPEGEAQAALETILKRVETDHPDVYFPIEVRKTAGDDAMLSPFQGGARVSVAIHSDPRDGYKEYFGDIEAIFRQAGGRPHWGKLHSLAANDLADLYPDYAAFCDIRARLDPKGRFLTDDLARLFT